MTITEATAPSALTAAFEEMKSIQSEFDALYFSGGGTADEKRRHVCFHLMKLVGKVATVEERVDHGEFDFSVFEREVIPDLLVFAAQLADLFDVDLAGALADRHVEIASRLGPSSDR